MSVGQKDEAKAAAVTMKAYRFAGSPTPEQAHLLSQFAGSCRFMWNRMLADINASYEAGEKYSCPTPAKYKDVPGLEWLKNMDSLGLANVQLHLDAAFKRFFKSCAGGPFAGHPSFKKKHESTDSYTTNLANKKHPNIFLDGCLLKLPKIKEPIRLRLHRQVEPGGLLKSVTVTHEATGKWYFSLLFEYPKQESTAVPAKNKEQLRHIGLDMSLPKLYVDSNGNVADFYKPYRKVEAKIAREQRKLSHMVKGSNNYNKQKQRIAKLHAKAKRQRNDMLHKLSFRLTEQYDVISIEDLDMAAIKQSLHFGKSASDNGWGNFTRMLAYKAVWKGKHIVKVDKWFPSSKTCCKCGHIHKELTLSDRLYCCPNCGNLMDRDHQAAINIDKEGFRLFCEELPSGCGDSPRAELSAHPQPSAA
jgi:putative transposase